MKLIIFLGKEGFTEYANLPAYLLNKTPMLSFSFDNHYIKLILSILCKQHCILFLIAYVFQNKL